MLLDHFSLIAPYYDRIFQRSAAGPLLAHVDPQPTDRMLDVGGGTGRVAQYFVGHVSQLCILDPSPRMLEQGQIKGICIVRGTAEELPFEADTFDRIMLIDAFHHLRDQETAIHELIRVLGPGGRLIIEEPDITHRGVRWVAWGEKLLMMRSHFYAPKEIQTLAQRAGARANIEHQGHTAWIIVEKE